MSDDAAARAALEWTEAAAGMRPDQVAEMRGRRGPQCVVSRVRARLDKNGLGSTKGKLYVDAVGVLKKLEEGINWRWF